ncbi:hypothetical protein HYV87_02515 [Candidatus Woesearchaeota archaeon]|nr:hypothetical protein [Candidatus Woesearchaeota archaeon]
MTNKKSGCGTMVAGALFAGLAFSYAATFGVGYMMGRPDDEEITASETNRQEALCDLVTINYLKQFNANCNKKNYDEGTILRGISDEWSRKREENDCEAQEWQWKCSPEDPSNKENSRYIVKTK